MCVCVKCVEGKVSSGFEDLVVLADGQEANWEVVERILFIYAKLNPGHGYVQVVHTAVAIDWCQVGYLQVIHTNSCQ